MSEFLVLELQAFCDLVAACLLFVHSPSSTSAIEHYRALLLVVRFVT